MEMPPSSAAATAWLSLLASAARSMLASGMRCRPGRAAAPSRPGGSSSRRAAACACRKDFKPVIASMI